MFWAVTITMGICSCNNNVELIALSDCPQKMEGFSVELSKNKDDVQKITISKDGKMLQELIEEEEPFFVGNISKFDNTMVFFVDANFDGETDLYIGTGEDRSSNTILLWNKSKGLFEVYKATDDFFQNPLFSPSENAIYGHGSISAFEGGYSKSIWNEGKLEDEESLTEIYDVNEYDFDAMNEFAEYKLSHKYTVLTPNNKLIAEADEIESLPEEWQKVLSKYEILANSHDEVQSEDEAIVNEEDTDDIEDEGDSSESGYDSYNHIGTNGTMRLEKYGVQGDDMSPNGYYGRYIMDDETTIQFMCYPHSKFGKSDFADITQCYNYNKSLVNTTLVVPSYVELEGKTYKVEGAILNNEGGKVEPNIGRYILPSTIKRINLAGWSELKEVVLSEGIEEITQRAFRYCVDLESIVMPNTLKKIGKLAFENCRSLKKIRIPASVVDVCDGGAFVGLEKGVTIEVEKGCEALKDLKPIKVDIRGSYGYEHYEFNPDDINIVYVE